MFRSLKIGAIIGAGLSLLLIPSGLGVTLPVLTPFFIILGALFAGILSFIVRITRKRARDLPLKTDLTFIEHFFYTMVLASVMIFGLIPTINAAREAARRSSCKNNLHIGVPHHCEDLVVLDREGQIDRVSACRVCDPWRRHSSPGYGFLKISFYNTMGRQLSDEGVPEELRQEAKQRLIAMCSDHDDEDD